MSNYIIANILSAVTACFTAAAAWVPDRRKSFILQVFQMLIYSAASYFFGMYSAIITMLLCVIRNYLVAVDKFTVKVSYVFSAVVFILGITANTAGITGIIPVVATVLYSIGCSTCTKLIASKWNISLNLMLWIIYDLLIGDISSLIMDIIGIVTGLAAIVRIKKLIREGKLTDEENAVRS